MLLTILDRSKRARIETFNFDGIFLLYIKYALDSLTSARSNSCRTVKYL